MLEPISEEKQPETAPLTPQGKRLREGLAKLHTSMQSLKAVAAVRLHEGDTATAQVTIPSGDYPHVIPIGRKTEEKSVQTFFTMETAINVTVAARKDSGEDQPSLDPMLPASHQHCPHCMEQEKLGRTIRESLTDCKRGSAVREFLRISRFPQWLLKVWFGDHASQSPYEISRVITWWLLVAFVLVITWLSIFVYRWLTNTAILIGDAAVMNECEGNLAWARYKAESRA